MDRCVMVHHNEVMWNYPETWPAERCLVLYHPCPCGKTITAVPVIVPSEEQGPENPGGRLMARLVDEGLRRYVQQYYAYHPGHHNQQAIERYSHQQLPVTENFHRPAEWLVYPEYSDSDELPRDARRRKRRARKLRKMRKSEAFDAER